MIVASACWYPQQLFARRHVTIYVTNLVQLTLHCNYVKQNRMDKQLQSQYLYLHFTQNYMISNIQPTVEEKITLVINNRGRFNIHENKIISQIQALVVNSNNSSLSFERMVQLETFYKCCRPAFESIYWEEVINYKVAYPLACIAAFRLADEKYYAVDVKVATWAQSGGARLMPLKSSNPQEKVLELLRCSHALIIPEFQGQVQFEFFEIISNFIRQNIEYPVIALGNSAIMLMSILNNCPQLRKDIRMDLKFNGFEMSVFASHQDILFRDLDLKVRLQIQNKSKVMSSSIHLPIKFFSEIKNQKLELINIGKGKTDDWSVVVVRQDQTHYCFIDPRQSGYNSDHISFVHKLIVNFMQQIRKRQRSIQEKGIQLGHYKVVLKDDKYFYNVDSKLPKI